MDDKQEMAVLEATGIGPEITAALTMAVREMVAPVLEQVAALLKNNTEAVQCIAAQEQIQSDRLAALERELRLNMPVTNAQVRYLSSGMKSRALELLAKRSLEETTELTRRLSGCIRKAVLARYGISSLRDLPRCEYSVAMKQIETWNDLMALREATRRAVWREVPAAAGHQESGLVEES